MARRRRTKPRRRVPPWGFLLQFRGPAADLEPAFRARFHAEHVARDRLYGMVSFGCNFALAIKMSKQARWGASALLIVECVLSAALLLLLRAHRGLYVRHRSPLIGWFTFVHNILVLHVQPIGFIDSCSPSGAWLFWPVEAWSHMVPWAAMSCLDWALPLQHAVWVQAGVVAVLLHPASLARSRGISTQLCARSDALYAAAARLASAAAGGVLPPPLGSVAMQAAERLSGAAAHHLVNVAVQLALSLVVPLAVLHRRELRQRRQFARERRCVPAVAGLLARQRSMQASLPGGTGAVLLAALLWTGACMFASRR